MRKTILLIAPLALVIGGSAWKVAERGRTTEAVRLPADVPGDWWAGAQEQIRRSEYEVSWQEKTCLPDLDAAYQAPNRAQDLRTYFTDDGVKVVRRTEPEPRWHMGLRLASVNGHPVGAARPAAEGNRVEYRRGVLSEWYVNDERGLEQGFTVESAPAGAAGKLVLQLALTGDVTAHEVDGGRAIEFNSPGGVRVLRYDGLHAKDARGRSLPAQMSLAANAIHISVDDSAAEYPVTVDPLITMPTWTAESDQVDARFGQSVSTAGDVDGDGFADVIVGAYTYDNGETDEGMAFVYHGSASGLSATADWTAESDQAGAFFGLSVGTAGDVNGDGYDDVIVGACYFDNGETDEGGAFVYHGSASGLSAAPAWTSEGDQADAYFGQSVSTAGDVDGDGFADVIVGAYTYDNGETDEGMAFVYHGSASGLSASPDWTAESDQVGALFGAWVSTAGDVNGDGYADVIVGAPTYDNGESNEGRAHVYHGSTSGLSASPDWTAESNQADASFGVCASTASDVNGDGYADVIVGAHWYDNGQTDEGRAYVYHGSGSGLSPTPDWTAEGNQASAYFGGRVATAGDVNGDGYADVIVTAYEYDSGEPDEGRAFVYCGSASGLSATADWTAESDQANAYFGASVGTAGDVNGDGFDEVIVGAYWFDNGQADEGRAWLYYGSAAGLGHESIADWVAGGGQAGAQFGYSVSTAGDVNGDGYADVIVGAYRYDNGETDEGAAFVFHGSVSGLSTTPDWTAEGNQADGTFGQCVGTGGDVNGDGYADVIVGAVYYDNGEVDEGLAFVYHGSASGLSATADWTAEGDQASAGFGVSVCAAGDVNGDGFADVVVGAHGYDNGETDEGMAFVYHGSPSGLSAAPDWTAESDQASAAFGVSVSTAGDVNGDGYADVIVGAYFYDNGESNEGGAFVYHGSASGLSAAPDWTAESNQASACLGESVATAGDVNGDGYADVIVGARMFDGGEADEGRAYVYHGSASGLSATADWTAESNQASAYFGLGVAAAGDVNGDGYADVIVGAWYYDNGETDEGMAFVYHGSASGLSATADWTAESDQADAHFGMSVSTAGDVNGDGYADVIVGAYLYDNGETDEGAAFIYYGGPSALSATPGWTAESNQASAEFGVSVSTAGDVNGDGYADVIVGARMFDNGEADEGRAYVYHGSASGLSATADWTAESDQAGALFGHPVSTAGDVNGDGFADVIVGAWRYDNGEADEGRAFVYHGSASGLSVAPDWTAESNQAGAEFGLSVSTAGDVNGDGYADVIVGADLYDSGETDEGRAHVYHGSASGLSAAPDWTAEGNQTVAMFGVSVATAGDVNGDGYADVIVGAHYYDNGETDEGRAHVYHGSASGLSAAPDWTAESDQAGANFGVAAATAGDVNGDGYADVIVGSIYYDNGQTDEGAAFVYHGSASGLSATPDWTAEGNQDSAAFGCSVGTAGDVNGDGHADVIVGAYHCDNGETDEGRAYVYYGAPDGLSAAAGWTAESNQASAYFGVRVATAGDVNGDGYADVIVGAHYFDNGQVNEGVAFLYYGNAGPGLSLNPRQRRADDTVPIAHLGAAPEGSFRVALLGRTPFGRGKVKLECEAKPLGTPFDGTGTRVSDDWLDTDTAGVELNELTSALNGLTCYHWRARLLYHPATTPFQQASRWLTMPWNGWQETRLRVPFILKIGNLAAEAMNECRIELTWTNPPDSEFDGVVIFRRAGGRPTFVPSSGVSYTEGVPYGDAVCVYVGTGESYSDTGLSPDTRYYYAVWTYDTFLGYYGPFDANATTTAVTAPTVTSTSPTDGEENVLLGAVVEVAFSEPMKEAETQGAFSIDGGVTGTFSWSDNTLTFTPDALLEGGTTYTVTVGAGAADEYDVSLSPSPFELSFTTRPHGGGLYGGGGCGVTSEHLCQPRGVLASLPCLLLLLAALARVIRPRR